MLVCGLLSVVFRSARTGDGAVRCQVLAAGRIRFEGGERSNRLETHIAGKDDYFRAKGVVVETLPNATFRVKLETGHEVSARASGKMRKGRMIRIIPGDSVEVDVSAYDPTMGRIVWRYR
jgi:translation initiation factor IF-1